jgi:hypothetical protein
MPVASKSKKPAPAKAVKKAAKKATPASKTPAKKKQG